MSKQLHPAAVAVTDDWRRWIAENLILGSPPPALVAVLCAARIAPDQARAEVERAQRSPYLHGAARLCNRLAKRDWLLETRARLRRIAPPALRRRHRLDAATFLREHYAANEPVIITGMLDDCAARRWTVAGLRARFALREVEVQAGRDADQSYEMNSVAHKRRMLFGALVDLIERGAGNDVYMTANNGAHNRAALAELWEDMPHLPDYLEQTASPQGFLWFGPAGTITPLHHDLTNNFMLQMVGRKRVRLVAPADTPRMYNARHCFSPVDAAQIDVARFPAMAEVQVLECVLEEGEILFLPVGWWHHVEALDVSITVAATHFRWENDFYSRYPAQHDF